MSRVVRHRWNPEAEDAPVPGPGEIVAGPRNHWRVVAVRPVDSEKYPHALEATMQPLGPHRLSREDLDRPRGWWIYRPRDEDPK